MRRRAVVKGLVRSLGFAALAAPLWLPLILISVALVAQAIMSVAPVPPEAEPALHATVMGVMVALLAGTWGRGALTRILNPDATPTGLFARPDPSGTLFTPTPLTGHRQWMVVPGERIGDGMPLPYLASPVFPTLWEGPELGARCASAVGRHPRDDVPALGCTCGIYARKAVPVPGSDRVSATGPVALSGLVLEGSEGFRASRARISGPLTVTLGRRRGRTVRILGWTVPPRRTPPSEIWLMGDRLVPVTPAHPPPGEPEGRWPIDEFARHTRTWLEARYGVPVTVKGA